MTTAMMKSEQLICPSGVLVFPREVLLNLQVENTHLRQQLQPEALGDEDELSVTLEEGDEEEETAEMWDTWGGQILLSSREEKLPSSSSSSSSSQVGGAPGQPGG